MIIGALRIKKRIRNSSDERPNISTELIFVGQVYFLDGQHEKALEYFSEALEIQDEAFGSKQLIEDVLACLISYMFGIRGYQPNARRKLRELISLSMATLINTAVSSVLGLIGDLYLKHKMYQESI